MKLRELIEEKESPNRSLSASRLLMIIGGAIWAVMSLALAAWSLLVALPKLLSGAWTHDSNEVALALIDAYVDATTVAAALAAPYAVRNLPSIISRLREPSKSQSPREYPDEPIAG